MPRGAVVLAAGWDIVVFALTLEPPTTDDRVIWDLWLSQYQLPVVLISDALGLFTLVEREAPTLQHVCTELGIAQRAAEAVLAVLCSQDFVTKQHDRFHLTDVGRTYLLPDSPFYWVPMLRDVGHGQTAADILMPRLHTDNLAFSARISQRWERGGITTEDARDSNRRFHSHSLPAALGMARAGDFKEVKRMLDVAGGSGCYSIALALHCPWLRCTVADLPAVAADSQTYIERFQCADRVDTYGFNMFDDEWPTGYDAIFFSNVLHDWDPDRRVDLVTKSFKTLPSGGHVYIHEMLFDEAADGPLPAALFSIMMLGTRGKQFTFRELEDLLGQAGFTSIDVRPSYGYYSLIRATRP
jgi:hypothetical protein